jgi:hypothetical protein
LVIYTKEVMKMELIKAGLAGVGRRADVSFCALARAVVEGEAVTGK